jgi:hypothetical protein
MQVLKGLITGILSFLLFILLAAFGLVFTLHSTVLNADFVVSEINKLDISSLVEEIAAEQLQQADQYVVDVINDVIVEIEPWIKEQASIVIHSAYDYALGRSDNLNITIDLEPVKAQVKEKLRTALIESPPVELQGRPPSEVDQYFNDFSREFDKEIPATYEIDRDSLPAEVWNVLQQIRHYSGYYRLAYWGLIGIMVLLILLIFLIQRNARGTSRSLGTTFLLYGALEFAGLWLTRNYVSPFLKIPDTPPSLQSWIQQVFNDILGPLQILSLGLLGAGIILIGLSFYFKGEQTD